MPLPPPVTTATFRVAKVIRALTYVLVVDQPFGEAEPFEVEHRGQRLQRWAWDGDRFATLDVVDDVADALLLELLLGLARACRPR